MNYYISDVINKDKHAIIDEKSRPVISCFMIQMIAKFTYSRHAERIVIIH